MGGSGNGSTPYASRSQVEELDRQLERGSLFTQATLQRGFRRIGDAESLLLNLVQALTAKGVVSEEELGVALDDTSTLPEAEAGDETGPVTPTINWPSIALRVDEPDAGDVPVVRVDCEARMPVCHAVCCRLKFPLSSEEIDAGQVKWDIGHPYIIRQESSGFCTHNDTSSGRCGVYDDRPAICRRYSCAGDTRIWTDFDAMVLNQQWIDDHLGRRDLHVSSVFPSMEDSG